jgi:hypothetical protein
LVWIHVYSIPMQRNRLYSRQTLTWEWLWTRVPLGSITCYGWIYCGLSLFTDWWISDLQYIRGSTSISPLSQSDPSTLRFSRIGSFWGWPWVFCWFPWHILGLWLPLVEGHLISNHFCLRVAQQTFVHPTYGPRLSKEGELYYTQEWDFVYEA